MPSLRLRAGQIGSGGVVLRERAADQRAEVAREVGLVVVTELERQT